MKTPWNPKGTGWIALAPAGILRHPKLMEVSGTYRGRLAPTPSGYLHAGHARTFFAAWSRVRQENGVLVFRVEDIDRERCRPEFEEAALEDLA